MKRKDDAKQRVQEAIEDPEVTPDPATLTSMTPQERQDYSMHRLLDSRIRQAFSELADQVDIRAIGDEEFGRRLSRGLVEARGSDSRARNPLAPAGIAGHLRAWLDFTTAAPYRWAPALVLLVLIPALPTLIQLGRDKQSVSQAQDLILAPSDTRSREEVGRPEPVAGAAPTRRKARTRTAEAPKMEAPEPILGGEPPAEGAGTLEKRKSAIPSADLSRERSAGAKPAEPAAAKASPPAEDETALEMALARARTGEAKARILRKLVALHKRNGAEAKRAGAESRLKALAQ